MINVPVIINKMNFINEYLNYISHLIERVDQKSICKFLNVLEGTKEDDNQIFILGNGGSAATANHFAEDLCLYGLKAVSLCANTAQITCLGNDFGYENIYSRQLEIFMNPRDVVVCISTSGKSKNVLAAAEYALKNKGIVVSMTGFDGEQLPFLSSLVIYVPSELKEAGPIEDIHMIICHLISAYFKNPSTKYW